MDLNKFEFAILNKFKQSSIDQIEAITANEILVFFNDKFKTEDSPSSKFKESMERLGAELQLIENAKNGLFRLTKNGFVFVHSNEFETLQLI